MEWSADYLWANLLYRDDLRNEGVYALLLEGGFIRIGQSNDINHEVRDYERGGVTQWEQNHKSVGRCYIEYTESGGFLLNLNAAKAKR